MNKEFRYHPIIEGLKVNEDGSEVIFQNKKLHISSFFIEESKLVRYAVRVAGKSVTINRLVCECWHGLAPNRDYSATLINENNGLHYSNLYWAKRGMKINTLRHRKVKEEDFQKIQERLKLGERITHIIKDFPFTYATYTNYKKYYGKEENE